MKIYIASPLHNKDDQATGMQVTELLREQGHQVYLPMEHGVVKGEDSELPADVQHKIFCGDVQAIQTCDCIVACLRRKKGPSEGMLWEMGFGYGLHKPVYLLNLEEAWDYGIMVRGGTNYVFEHIGDLIKYLKEEDFS